MLENCLIRLKESPKNPPEKEEDDETKLIEKNCSPQTHLQYPEF